MNTFQQRFAQSLFHPQVDIPAEIQRAQSDALRRFAIYRNNVILSLGEAVSDTYPVTKRLLGDHAFSSLAYAYVREYPPTHPVMAAYAGDFISFIQARDPCIHASVLDLMRLEYLWLEAYHACDENALEISALAAVAENQTADIRFNFLDCVQWLETPYALSQWWLNLREAESLEPIQQAQLHASNISAYVIFRHEEQVYIHELETPLFKFCQQLTQSASLGEAAYHATQIESQFDLTKALQYLFQQGLLKNFSFPSQGAT